MGPSGWVCWNLPFSSFRGAPQLGKFGCWHLPKFISDFADGAAQKSLFFFLHICSTSALERCRNSPSGNAQLCSGSSFTHCSQNLSSSSALLNSSQPSSQELGAAVQHSHVPFPVQLPGESLCIPSPCSHTIPASPPPTLAPHGLVPATALSFPKSFPHGGVGHRGRPGLFPFPWPCQGV